MKSLVFVIALAFASPASASCFIAGDSIAVDLRHDAMRGCEVNAKSGIPSGAVIGRVPSSGHYDLIVISAGSNDPDNPRLAENLTQIARRSHAVADRVLWILPIAARPRHLVAAAADSDPTVSFVPARDRVHPRNNHALARDVRLHGGRK